MRIRRVGLPGGNTMAGSVCEGCAARDARIAQLQELVDALEAAEEAVGPIDGQGELLLGGLVITGAL